MLSRAPHAVVLHAVVRIHALQMCQHNIAVESVLVLRSRVLDHRVRNRILVLAGELTAASRTLLFETHLTSHDQATYVAAARTDCPVSGALLRSHARSGEVRFATR